MLNNYLSTTFPVQPPALNYLFMSSVLQQVPCEKCRVLLRVQAWGFMIPQIVQATCLRSTHKKLGFLLQNQEMAILLLPCFIYFLQELGFKPFYFLWHFPFLDGHGESYACRLHLPGNSIPYGFLSNFMNQYLELELATADISNLQ